MRKDDAQERERFPATSTIVVFAPLPIRNLTISIHEKSENQSCNLIKTELITLCVSIVRFCLYLIAMSFKKNRRSWCIWNIFPIPIKNSIGCFYLNIIVRCSLFWEFGSQLSSLPSCPFLDAQCNGVFPCKSCESTNAPAVTRTFTTSK